MAKKYGTSMQLWPSGESVTYIGDANGGEDLRIRSKSGRWVKPSAELARKIRIEYLAEMYAERDILCCDSSLVSDMIQNASELPHPMSSEWDLYDGNVVCNLTVDPTNWTVEQCKEWIDDNMSQHDYPDPDPWEEDEQTKESLLDNILNLDPDEEEYKTLKKLSLEKIQEIIIEKINDEEIDGLEDWRDVVRNNASDYQAEPYEWYRVDSWLANRLKEIGEVVLDNQYGTWWGRCATGQSLIMDGTLQQVAAQCTRGGY